MIKPPEDYPLPWEQAFNGEDYVIRDAHLTRVANFVERDAAAYAAHAANALPGLKFDVATLEQVIRGYLFGPDDGHALMAAWKKYEARKARKAAPTEEPGS